MQAACLIAVFMGAQTAIMLVLPMLEFMLQISLGAAAMLGLGAWHVMVFLGMEDKGEIDVAEKRVDNWKKRDRKRLERWVGVF